MKKPVLLLTFASLIALGAGFLREVSTAYYFGTTAGADAFTIALFYSEAVMNVVVYGLAGYALVPVVTRFMVARQGEEAFRLMETVLLWLGVIGVPIAAVNWVNPDLLASLMAPEFSVEQHSLLVELLRWSVPAAVLISLGGIMSGVLQARADYYTPTYGNVLFNIGIALTFVIGVASLGVVAGGVGLFIGALMQMGLQGLMLVRTGWRPRWPRAGHPALSIALKAGFPTLLAIILIGVLMGGGQRLIASGLPTGSFAAVNYAQRTLGIVSGLTLSFATVSLTELSLLFNSQGLGSATLKALENSLKGGAFLVTPAACLLVILSEPLIILIFQRGQYSTTSVQLTVSCLRWFGVSLVPGLLVAVLHRVFPAFQHPWRTTGVSLIWAVATLFFTGWLLMPLGPMAIPAAYTLGVFVACIASLIGLGPFVGWRFIVDILVYLGRVVLCSGISVVSIILLSLLLPWPAIWHFQTSLSVIATTTAVFGATYLVVCIIGRDPQVITLMTLARTRWLRAGM